VRFASLLEKNGMLSAPVFIVLFVFFIPISPTMKSIFFVLAMATIVITPFYNKRILQAYNTLWGRAVLLLLAYIAIATLWSSAPLSMQWMVVNKYSKLIYLPLLAVGFIQSKTRLWSMNAFLASIFLTCIISVLKSQNIIQSFDPGQVFYNHIITGFMVALGFYLSGLFAFKAKGWQRMIYFTLMMLTSYQLLFINTGRTGYVVYCILAVLLLMQKLTFKRAVLAVVLFIIGIAAVYQVSTTMQLRVNDLINEVKSLEKNNPNTSFGYRIQFHNYSKSLLAKHPLTGIGTGGFKYSFSQDNPVPGWGTDLSDPHSQYWMTLSEQGIIGLVLLLGFLFSLLVTSFQLTETKPIIIGVLASFCAGSFSDTILCYSTAGYLLIVMSALCFGELIEKRVYKTIPERELNLADGQIVTS